MSAKYEKTKAHKGGVMDLSTEPQVDLQEGGKSLTLREFALQEQITEERVWEMIEEGELSARFVNETILIYRECPREQTFTIPNGKPQEPQVEEPDWQGDHLDFGATPEASILPEPDPKLSKSSSPTLARALELAQQLLDAKEAILQLKDDKISNLEKQLTEKDAEIKKLRREVENYQTLCRVSKNPQLLRDVIGEP